MTSAKGPYVVTDETPNDDAKRVVTPEQRERHERFIAKRKARWEQTRAERKAAGRVLP